MNIKLNFIKEGNGSPLVLLHGNGESLSYFEKQIDYFKSFYTVYAIDTRGHGLSPRGEAPFTLSQFSLDLKDFLDSQNLKDIVLLGFSDGANIALHFALKHQDYLKALILNGGNLNPRGVKRTVQFPIEIGYFFAKLFKNHKKRELYSLMVNEPDFKESELSAIHVPTLVIAGTNDMIKQSCTQKIHSFIKGSTLKIIKGDHFIANKNSDEFNDAVKCFLDGVK